MKIVKERLSRKRKQEQMTVREGCQEKRKREVVRKKKERWSSYKKGEGKLC